MPLLNIDDAGSKPAPRFALFELGFRPFFLCAGIAAVLLVVLWVYAYARGLSGFGYYGAAAWHSHEMLFGYTAAVIAGFLLTAARNWTGIQTLRGTALAGLVALWLAGRIVPFLSGTLGHGVIAAVDLAFLPVFALTLAVPLLRSRQTHNLVFLPVLAALTGANLMVHLQLLGIAGATANRGTSFAVYLVVLLIALLGGRVIPSFTESSIPGARTRRWAAVEYLAPGALIVMMLLDLAGAVPVAVLATAILAAIAHGVRLFGWYQARIWSVPLLWVLHLGYAWLVAGFLLTALSAAGVVNPVLAIHTFTTGGIGTVTLGMMARVSLGHTGRMLQVGPAMSRAFVLANLAAVTRVFVPIVAPDSYVSWIVLSGVLWSAAFAIFVIVYARILIQPRVDGRPG